jgi:YD repeat-containing protein
MGESEGEGSVPAGTHNVIATFDPTLLLNGAYQFRVKAVTVSGDSGEDFGSAVVEGNMKIGDFSLVFTDLIIPVAGIPITINRIYDTLDKRKGDFGFGWTLQMSNVRLQKSVPLDERWEELSQPTAFFPIFSLRESKKHFITITFPGGDVYRFKPVMSPLSQQGFPIRNARIDYVPMGNTVGTLRALDNGAYDPSGNFLSIVNANSPNGAGSIAEPVEVFRNDGPRYNPVLFELTTPEGSKMIIHEQTGLVSVTDANANSVQFTPNSIVSSNGISLFFEKDGQGRITKITNPEGNPLLYVTDGNGDLVSFTDPKGRVTTYSYDANHRMTRIVDNMGRIINTNTFNISGRLTTVKDTEQVAVNFQHGIDLPSPTFTETIIDKRGFVTKLTYDVRGNVVREERTLGTRPIVTTRTYDDPLNPDLPTSVTDALGNTTTFTYSALGDLLSTTNALGHTTTYMLDSVGRVLTETNALGITTVTNTYDTRGNLTKMVDALGNAMEFTYDARGLVLSAKDALGNISTMEYDSAGRMIAEVDKLGHRTDKTLNFRGDATQVRDLQLNSSPLIYCLRTDLYKPFF